MMRKIVAFVLLYSFYASSLWAFAPGLYLPTRGRMEPAVNATLSGMRSSFKGINRAAENASLLPASSLVPATKVFSNAVELTATADPQAVAGNASGAASTTIGFFGPQEYVRTTGDPNTYTTSVQVPAWIASPFNLHIQNGEADGTYRISSATISINNTQIAAAPSDFNQNVFTLDRNVTLTPQTTLTVTLASKPGSFLLINLSGTNQDHTPPVVKIDLASAINNPEPHLQIEYQDVAGPGEPAASGVNTTTLKVLVDGVDRTSLFTKRASDAGADWPASLALAAGPHTIAASIQDNAGNLGQATLNFQVDLTPPTLQILQPVAGTYLNTTTPQIQLSYGDNLAVDPASLKVIVNGIDRSALFTKTSTGAIATLDATTALPQTANQIVATISDTAGNSTTASVAFNVDTTPPTIAIVHPSPGSRHGNANVEVSLQYSDDQALDPSSLTIAVDGAAQPISAGPLSASTTATLADGDHTITASIRDKAGNQSTTTSTFSVDTVAPDIHILQPAAGAILNVAAPPIQLTYSDNDLDSSTFRFQIDGVDQTSLFTITATGANATPPPLADGRHSLSAQVSDLTGNVGTTSNSVLIDTVKPSLTIAAPAGPTNHSTPSALIQYSDSGSGIDPTSVRISLDGADVTSAFSIASDSATGTLGSVAALAEGPHQLQASVSDKAKNTANATAQFLVDLTPPQASFTSPADNSFINNPQPTITLSYSDAISGVDPNSVHIFLQQGTTPETDITSLFAVGANQATAVIPATSPLSQATYHLRAQLADKAGNSPAQPVIAAFVVDTTPPSCAINSPAANAYLKTATPTVAITCHDDSSGIDPAKYSIQVDGLDATSQLTVNESGASGNLAALADGTHQLQVTAFDRAGNQAPVETQSFLVDTIAPAISIVAPATAAFTNNNHTPVSISFSDSGSGIDVTAFSLSIDGVDHTAEFAVTATGASGSPAIALGDGSHVITATVRDLAANANSATATYIIDTLPPQISITQPQDGSFTNATAVSVSGTVTDASPVTVTVEGASVPLAGNAFTSAQIPLRAGPTQALHVSATDAAGNSSSAVINLNIDRVPPTIVGTIAPAPNAAGWNNTDATVSFTCSDDSSGVAFCSPPVR